MTGAMAIEELPLDGLQRAVAVLSAKWSVAVLAALADGTHRFNQLLREIDGISRRMLAVTLRRLEHHGLVERRVYATVPARVEYELSPAGEELLAALAPLAGWGANATLGALRTASP
jgi:DNA-binding HxlR family transcriptional regulator